MLSIASPSIGLMIITPTTTPTCTLGTTSGYVETHFLKNGLSAKKKMQYYTEVNTK
jgi:hypothetical protein